MLRVSKWKKKQSSQRKMEGDDRVARDNQKINKIAGLTNKLTKLAGRQKNCGRERGYNQKSKIKLSHNKLKRIN